MWRLILALLALPAVAFAQVPAPDGARLLFALGADGVQIYACQARDGGHAWVFQAPEAMLFDASGRQVGTHGAGPGPEGRGPAGRQAALSRQRKAWIGPAASPPPGVRPDS